MTPVSGYAIRPAKPVSITTVASGGSTHGPPGLHSWITYQTHQPHQTARVRSG
nr:hypothetical protein [uncultured Methanospirillum sp.]